MSISLAKEKSAFAKEDGKLKKILKAVKKFFAKEFLWVIGTLLFAIPLALLCSMFFQSFSSKKVMETIMELFKGELFLGFYVLNLIGIYFIRTVIGSLKIMTKKATK